MYWKADQLYAIRAEDGKRLWSAQSDHTYTSLTIDNGMLYTLTQKGEVVALSEQDGTQRWIYASSDAFWSNSIFGLL